MKRPNAPAMVSLVMAAAFLGSFTYAVEGQSGATDAPAAFDNKTNGFLSQDDFDAARRTFEERDNVRQGLGPVYNAQSCAECHQSPVTGAGSQVSELRAGHRDDAGHFVEAPGGSLINDRAIKASIQEYVPDEEDIRTLRMSTNALGAGFVEAISSNTLVWLANAQPGQSGGAIAGLAIRVPVLEAPGSVRVGRFGWKDQHGSLLSFSADAYLNEIGITNRLALTENTSMGDSIAVHDNVPDDTPCERDATIICGEDPEEDIEAFAAFMRSTKAPPRAAALARTADAMAGEDLFKSIGCSICHTPSITTAPEGTVINGGALIVAAALGNKTIYPYSDFLLHDIGTGDGIVQNGGPSTANRLRTLPLWGARMRSRHMHDGEALTFNEAILRHAGEARYVTGRYRYLSPAQRRQIVTFLQSL
jgi:CxxC motif-containing protein (DUF1111 family)